MWVFLNPGNLIIPNLFPNESGKIWQSREISISLWCSSGMLQLSDPGWGGEGWLKGWRCFSHPNPWQKISGFEDANLCRKCRLSVEHFVSSRKTTTKKAKCGVFVFLSRNIYQFSERGGGMGGFPFSSQIFGMGLGSPLCPRSVPAAPQGRGQCWFGVRSWKWGGILQI